MRDEQFLTACPVLSRLLDSDTVAAEGPDLRVEVLFESLDRGVRIEAVAVRRVECAGRGVPDHLPGAA